jgi:CRISPR-associated protein Csx14
MGVHMADANGVRIEIDPLNPAQFFACCGILELLSERSPDVLARFAYQENQFRKVTFVLSGVGEVALTGMLTALRNSKAISTTGFSGGEAPVDLEIPGTCNLTLDWWLVPERNIKSKFKLWAGQQTTLKLVQDMLGADWGNLGNDVLAFRLPMSGRFGLDPRSAWNALDFGSSPNTQNRDAFTYPAAEMLAAIGLQGFRPKSNGRRSFSYRLWEQPLPLVPARAAAAGALTCGSREYAFAVEKRSGSYWCFTFAQPINQ